MSRAPERFETERLRALRVTAEDEPFVCTVFDDERVAENLGGPRDSERVHRDVQRWSAHWSDHGFGLWVLRDFGTSEPVGWTMLHLTDTGGTAAVEVGWTIVAQWWRQGLASEAGAEAVRIGFDALGLDEVVGFTQPHNVASRGVMEKLGMQYDREVEHAGLPHVLYRLDRQTWEKTHG